MNFILVWPHLVLLLYKNFFGKSTDGCDQPYDFSSERHAYSFNERLSDTSCFLCTKKLALDRTQPTVDFGLKFWYNKSKKV